MMRKLAKRERAEPKMPDRPITITDEEFDQVVRSYGLVVVDLWAPWCGPCLVMAPIIEELAKKYAGRVVFAKLNVDENPLTAMKYDVRAIPTFLVFKRGRLVARWIGAMPKEALEARLSKLLAR
ncbi:MAG TPA: thioredoxin [Candidatus Bathyarchaeota archaeon]|nr:thioredoxin [Candidatus Bathyarchaeota archaeon]